MHLHPDAHISAEALARGERAFTLDSAFASLAGSLYGGVILVAFALALGADSLTIGVLSAIPFISQAIQVPAVALVERLQQRKKIAVIAVTISRTLILSLAVIPFLASAETALGLLVAIQIVITLLGATTACALNSWLHQLVPRQHLGRFFSRRLFWSTVIGCAGSLGAGYMIDHLPLPKLHVYAISFAAAGIAGYVSSWYLALIPEPAMVKLGPPVSVWSKVRAPFGDANFRPLLVFMGAWNGISNLAAPFLSVYLMKQLGYSVGTVTTMWVASQIANALTLYSWGRLSDRLSNKAILAAALPAYFLCMLGLVFTAMPASATARLAALYALHAVMGAAGGGIGLATGNIGLKLAPQGEGTAYLSTISMVNSIAGGIAPIVGGALAQAFAASHLSVFVQWVSIANVRELAVVHVTHWQFLFALSFILGFYVLHTLSRVREGQEISQRAVIQEIGLEAMRTVNQMSSIAGLTGGLVWFGRAVERRLWWRHGGAPPAESTGEPPARKRVSATGGPAAS